MSSRLAGRRVVLVGDITAFDVHFGFYREVLVVVDWRVGIW